MRAAIFNGPGFDQVGTRPDPIIKEPSDAVVRVVLACVCGSDLTQAWSPIGGITFYRDGQTPARSTIRPSATSRQRTASRRRR